MRRDPSQSCRPRFSSPDRLPELSPNEGLEVSRMVADQLDYVVGVDPHRDEHAVGVVDVRSGVIVFETAVAADSGATVPQAAISSPRTRSRKTRSRSITRTSAPSRASVIANDEPASPPPTTITSKLDGASTAASVQGRLRCFNPNRPTRRSRVADRPL